MSNKERLINLGYIRKLGKSWQVLHIPDNKWVNNKQFSRYLRSIDSKLSNKEYYDKYFKSSKEGLCKICNKSTKFLGLTEGYRDYCSKSCIGKANFPHSIDDYISKYGHLLGLERYNNRIKSISSTLIKRFSDPNDKLKETHLSACRSESHRNKLKEATQRNWNNNKEFINLQMRIRTSDDYKNNMSRIRKELRSDPNSKYNTEEFRAKVSSIISNLWKSPEYSNRLLLNNNKFYKNNISKISIELFSNIKNELSNYNMLYGFNEYIVNCGDKFYKLDFYIPELNKWIEFNGDYWHRNPRNSNYIKSNILDCVSIWRSDRIRLNNIRSIINTEPLVIWESDYKSNKESIVNKCIKFILNEQYTYSI